MADDVWKLEVANATLLLLAKVRIIDSVALSAELIRMALENPARAEACTIAITHLSHDYDEVGDFSDAF